MYLAGIDEAGRGPVIGPMVMAIAAIEEKDEFELKTFGVKDSKLLTPIQRRELAVLIERICEIELEVISPQEIDEAVQHPSRNLNILEAEVAGRLIDRLAKRLDAKNIKQVVLDCPSVNAEAYLVEMGRHTSAGVDLVAEHKADLHHLVVGAASIIAKVKRDALIEELKKEHGVDFGSGYPGDALTARFVRQHYKDYGFFRRTWVTYKDAVAASSQVTLDGFGATDALSPTVAKKQQKLLTLLDEGFERAETKGASEVLRLKKPGVTITLYTTGKLLVQGKEQKVWEAKLR